MEQSQASTVRIQDRSWFVAENLEVLSRKMSSIVHAMNEAIGPSKSEGYLVGLVDIMDDMVVDLEELTVCLNRLTEPERKAVAAAAER